MITLLGSPELLDQLASQFPAEVLANPALQLLPVETERGYGAFSLRSLVCLSLSSELKQETQLLEETKRRMHEALDQLRSQELVGLSCVWLWQRAFTLRRQDCDGLIDQELDFSLEYRAFVDGDMGDICSAIPRLTCDDPDLVQSQMAEVASFLRAIDHGSLNAYVDSRVDHDGDREHNGDSETLLTILSDQGRYSTECLILFKDDEPILKFDALTNEFDSISYKDGVVWVAVGEHEEVERDYYLSLGELQQLHALAEHSGHIPEDWHHSLASLLIA